jgi:hypothetical protein
LYVCGASVIALSAAASATDTPLRRARNATATVMMPLVAPNGTKSRK